MRHAAILREKTNGADLEEPQDSLGSKETVVKEFVANFLSPILAVLKKRYILSPSLSPHAFLQRHPEDGDSW